MKELSIEEKAKRYDEAIKVARGSVKYIQNDIVSKYIFGIFPELKENEDERAWLTKFIQAEIDCLRFDIRDSEDRTKLENLQRSLAWLEKQRKNNMGISEATKQELEDNLHKALEKETPESWNELLNEKGEQKSWNKEDERMLGKCIDAASGYYSPEDKQSMKDWLYRIKDRVQQQPKQEWSEEDEFILEDAITAVDMTLTSKFQESNPNLYKSFEVAKHWLKSIKERYAWKSSEEQQNIIDVLRLALANSGELLFRKHGITRQVCEDFIESIRPNTEKREWSEEDEKTIRLLIAIVENNHDDDAMFKATEINPTKYLTRNEVVERIKLLRPLSHWKPSDEQIKAIGLARSFVVDDFDEHPALSEILVGIEEQLKKLREE